MADYLFTALVTLFVTIDPLALAPLFVTVTSDMSEEVRRRTALIACLTAGSILVAFALIGQPLLGYLGITLPAFRVAGGLMLFWIGFEMVFDLRQRRKTEAVRPLTVHEAPQVAVFPLAIPLISGPGAISATILTASRAADATAVAGLVGVILVLIGACYAVFRVSTRIDRVLGPIGRIVLSRLLGILLAALAVQFVADGVAALILAGQP